MANFAELFCERYDVAPEKFPRAMFWRCLHRRAWLLLPILVLLPDEYFAADYQLIRDVGRLTRARGLADELADFYSNPSQLRFARRHLRLRVSGRRVSREVHRIFAAAQSARPDQPGTRLAS